MCRREAETHYNTICNKLWSVMKTCPDIHVSKCFYAAPVIFTLHDTLLISGLSTVNGLYTILLVDRRM
jgi:hypothetical protein